MKFYLLLSKLLSLDMLDKSILFNKTTDYNYHVKKKLEYLEIIIQPIEPA